MSRELSNRIAPYLVGLSLIACFVFAACGGASADGNGIQVKLVTPVADASPTQDPAATLTPIVPPELVLSTFVVYQSGAVLVSVTGDITGGTANFLGRNFRLAKGTRPVRSRRRSRDLPARNR